MAMPEFRGQSSDPDRHFLAANQLKEKVMMRIVR
jgi:hypothetical protein